jgi:hypothetical protein
MKGYVYAACCKRTGAIIYIGATHNVSVRAKQHFSTTKSPIKSWVVSNNLFKSDISFTQIAETEYGKRNILEGEYIRLLTGCGVSLLNIGHSMLPNKNKCAKSVIRKRVKDLLGVKNGNFTSDELLSIKKKIELITDKVLPAEKPKKVKIVKAEKKKPLPIRMPNTVYVRGKSRRIENKIVKGWERKMRKMGLDVYSLAPLVSLCVSTVYYAIRFKFGTPTTINKIDSFFSSLNTKK